MKKIAGYFKHRPGAPPTPYVWAMVQLPGGAFTGVDFLVDTGADKTILHPADANRLGLGAPSLKHSKNKQTSGIGGVARYRIENVRLVFESQEGPITWNASILRGPCGDKGFQVGLRAGMPSLLGRDFLQYVCLAIDWKKNHVFLRL